MIFLNWLESVEAIIIIFHSITNLLNLMTKRLLPPRANRGKNSFYTLEAAKDQDQKTKMLSICTKKSSKSLVKDQVGSKILNLNKKKERFQPKVEDKFTMKTKRISGLQGESIIFTIWTNCKGCHKVFHTHFSHLRRSRNHPKPAPTPSVSQKTNRKLVPQR